MTTTAHTDSTAGLHLSGVELAFRDGDEARRDFYFGNLEPWRLPLCSAFQQELNPPRRFLRRDPYDNQNGEIESLTRALDADEYETDSRVLRYEELA